jgi:hypothetical protein
MHGITHVKIHHIYLTHFVSLGFQGFQMKCVDGRNKLCCALFIQI